jgi:hypothetical protein
VARFDELPLKIERCGVVNASEMDEVEDHGLGEHVLCRRSPS